MSNNVQHTYRLTEFMSRIAGMSNNAHNLLCACQKKTSNQARINLCHFIP